MALINIKHQEVLAMLEKDLFESIENGKFINVHIYSSLMEISHCVVPDDIVIGDDIMITQGNFQVTINMENATEFDIEYDNIENGYHVNCDGMDFYFDF